MKPKTKLHALAEQLWRKAETTGKAGIPLEGGLYLACYVATNQTTTERIVRFARVRVPPSEHELNICRPNFAIPPAAKRTDYTKQPDWHIVQFAWSVALTETPIA